MLLMEGGEEWRSVSKFDVSMALLEVDFILDLVGHDFLGLKWQFPQNCPASTVLVDPQVALLYPPQSQHNKAIAIDCECHWNMCGIMPFLAF